MVNQLPEQEDVVIKTVTDPRLLDTYSLVLSAVKIDHRIRSAPNHFEILVPSELRESAERELSAYERENKDWPPRVRQDSFAPTLKVMSIVVVGFLLLIYNRTGSWQDRSLWFLHGAGNSDAILSGNQYFRLVTSLTLHADLVHLLSNCILGGFVIHFFLGITGNGLGLLLLVSTGAIANYINVVAHGPGHHFVGFSTSIFCVIGMLCTINYQNIRSKPLLHFFMPIMAGLALLAFLGSSGPRTDLGAHFFGLITGLAAGNIVRLKAFNPIRRSFFYQFLFGCCSFVLVYLSWHLAFLQFAQ